MPSSPGAEEPPTKELFASICYFIASSVPVQRADQLRHVLDTNGAIFVEKGSLDPTLTTIITNSHRFEGWEDVVKVERVHVVTDKWVERSVVLGKMQLTQYFSPDPSMIFSGIVACAAELPPTDLEVLSAGITALGGQWRTGLTRDVTHLFALNAKSLKYTTAIHYREETGIRVVLPHWFDDAVRLGMGNLPTKPYEWPDPELLKGADGLISEKENVKARGKAALAELSQNDVKRNMYATAAIFTPTLGQSSPPAESDISLVLSKVPGPSNDVLGLNLKQMQVWEGRKIVLSRTLELYKGRREAVQVGIERAGGVVLRFDGDGDEPEPITTHQKQGSEKLSKKERIRRRDEALRVADCDILVTRWRHGRGYVSACQGGKTVGTLAWLFHVQSSGVLSNPQDQLLHYPVPKRNIEAFSKHVITVTNYTGETREYIKKLIAAMGATFTPSMSGENTALIAAYLGGTKADKAQSWSIPIVNHTWLEDCFIQWRNLTMALEKYIVFPHGVDFSSLLGERGVGVGNQVADEVEELATTVFEEDEDYVSDRDDAVVDNHVDVEMPNGTEGSAKEVANGLVGADETETAVPVAKPQSTTSTKSLKPPKGMDVDFEPPSTAAIVTNHMDWNVDVDLDENDNAPEIPNREEEEEEEPVKPKKSRKIKHGNASSKAGSRRVSRQTPQEDEDEVEIKEINIRKKKNARTVPIEEVVDEEPVVESKKVMKVRSKVGKQVQKVIELDSEDESPKRKMKKKVENIMVSEEEDEEEEVAVVEEEEEEEEVAVVEEEEEEEEEDDENNLRSKTTTNSKAKPVSASAKTAHSEKTSNRLKAKPTPIPSPSDSDGEEAPPKKSRKRNTVSSHISSKPKKDNHETENDSERTADEKPKAGLRRKLTVEVLMISPAKRKGKGKEVQRSDDDIDVVQESKKSKSTSADVIPKVGKPAQARPEGLLRKAKGDARTRIKKKSISKEDPIPVESEEEDSPVQAKSTRRLQNGRREAASKDKEDPRPSKRKPKMPPPKKTKAAGRSKPLRVYSSDDVESEDDETSINIADAAEELESDDDLPATINLPSGSGSRTKKKEIVRASIASTSRRRESDTRNNKELSDAEPSAQGNQSTPTLKRTISVLSPFLAMSASPNGKRKKKADYGADNFEVVHRPKKSRVQVPIPVSDSDSDVDEDEVDLIVRRSAITKSNSLKATVGQSSSKDVVNSSMKSREQEKKNRSHSTSGRRKATKVERVAAEIDDDLNSRSSPASVSGPSVAAPRRNAAARATQRLHETVMPDLVNYEAQMKKAKGKGRQSAGSLSAFALEEEEEEEQKRDVGKRKKSVHVEEESDGEVQPKKKRRVSDEVEDTIKVKGKAKGKQKAKEDSEAEVEGRKSLTAVVVLTTQLTLPEDVLKSLTKLGVRMTTRPSECTHLLCPHIVRTEKFLCALTRAPFILSAKWATASAAAKKLLPEKNFSLTDPAGEKKFDVNLAQALRRAKSHKGKLLDGKTFYLTPRVSVDKKLLKSVVSACGGEITTQSPSLRIIKAAPEKRHVISCKEDISMWRPIAMEGYKIYNQELLLAGIMRQQIEWDREDFIVDP